MYSETEISEIIAEAKAMARRFDVGDLFLKLGAHTVGARKPPPKNLKTSYQRIGHTVFDEAIKRIQKTLCHRRRPKLKLIHSEWYALVPAILSDLSWGTLVVLLAIIMKKGLVWLCNYR